ncbi:MAG TPA: LacI family DNA-binding transcriptional regulator [Chloroflexota bacterium]|nr:LacI family DNA-binding transcriptional regulator [Chloroflexota bacterium]
MSARLKDVAERTGVSIKTVSNVINQQHARVGPETRARVLAVIEELGYRPHAAAKGLRLQRSHTIGFVTDEIATTPYAGSIIKGAQDEAWMHGTLLMIINTGKDTTLTATAIEKLLERRVEGIIYATMFHKVVHLPDTIREVPAILLNCYCADRSIPSVVPDEVTGGREATEALLRKGHRRIGMINAGRVIPAAIGRLEGYKQALAAYDVPFDRSLVRAGNTMADSGYHHTLELMRLPDPPSAIFCGTDRMAMGAYDALRELGLSIPGDMAVRGFDNEDVIAPYLRPPLSTSALPHYELGQGSVRYLLAGGEDWAEREPIQQVIHCPLIERAST